MRTISKTLVVATGALIVSGLIMSAPEIQARPQYLKQFNKVYPKLKEAADTKKCAICHDPADKKKKTRNQYGQAVGAGLGKDANGDPVKNEKNVKNIDMALEKAEEVKSKKTGMTFGEMIEAGKLPE